VAGVDETKTPPQEANTPSIESVVDTADLPQDTNTPIKEYEMNGRWNCYGMFYAEDEFYYFSDPRDEDSSNNTPENVLNYVYKTEDFITFEKVEPAQTYYQQTFMEWDFKEINGAMYEFQKTIPQQEEVLAFNEYRDIIYYSQYGAANKLFTYDLHTQKFNEDPILDTKGYDIVGINVCGEKLILGLILAGHRDFKGYFSNFGGAATYVANLDGSDLREVIIPQCAGTVQTFNYEVCVK
jgi:hypothetical protein